MAGTKRIAGCMLLVLGLVAGGAMAQIGGEPPGGPDAPTKISWPSADHPSLQSAVDALAPGGVIQIAEGVHVLEEPVRIEGRDLTIRGAGSDPAKKKFTHLVGPPPRPVADEEHNILLAPEDALAMFHSVASELRIEKLRMSGFDTAVLMENDDANRSGHTRVSGCEITETGRGLLSLSTGTLNVHDTEISDTVWHGISVAPRVTLDAVEPGFGVIGYDLGIVNPAGAGIYLSRTFATISGAEIERARAGCIVGYQAKVILASNELRSCVEAGILMFGSDAFPFALNEIQDNEITGSTPLVGILGDGIALFNSGSELVHNRVSNNARAGVSAFGSLLRWEDNRVTCSGAFDLQLDGFDGESAVLDDRGGNVCGCGGSLGACPTTSGVPQPPGMVGGLE